MDTLLHAFRQIAPYLTHPLVLIGLVLLLFFGIHGQLIDSGIIPPLAEEEATGVVHALLRYGFWIALAITVLGFVLALQRQRKADAALRAKDLTSRKGGFSARDEIGRGIEVEKVRTETDIDLTTTAAPGGRDPNA
jgi:hypothetical protein